MFLTNGAVVTGVFVTVAGGGATAFAGGAVAAVLFAGGLVV